MKDFRSYYDIGVIILVILASPICANYEFDSSNGYEPISDDFSFQDVFCTQGDEMPFEPDFFGTEISLDMSDKRLYDSDIMFQHDDDSSVANEPLFSVLYPNHPHEQLLVDIELDFLPEGFEDCPESMPKYHDLTFIDPIYDPPEPAFPTATSVRITEIADFYKDPIFSTMFDETKPEVSVDVDFTVIDNPSCSDSLDNLEDEHKRGGFFQNMRSKLLPPHKSEPTTGETPDDVCDPDQDEVVIDDPNYENYLLSPDDFVAKIEALKEDKVEDLEEELEAKKSLVSLLFDLVPHSAGGYLDHFHHDDQPCDMEHFMKVVLYDLDLIHDLYSEMEKCKSTHEFQPIQKPVVEEMDDLNYVETYYDPSYYGPHYIEETRNSVHFHSNHLPAEGYPGSSVHHPGGSASEYYHDHYDDYIEPDIKYDLLHFIPRLVHTGHNVVTNLEENFIQAKETVFSLMPDFRRTRYQHSEPAEPEYIPDEISSFYDCEPDVYEELWIRQNHPEYLTKVENTVVVNEPGLEVIVDNELDFNAPTGSTYHETVKEEVIYNPHSSYQKPCYYEVPQVPPTPYHYEPPHTYPQYQNGYYNNLPPVTKPLGSTYVNNNYYVEPNPRPTYTPPYSYSNQFAYGFSLPYNINYPSPKVKTYQHNFYF